MKFLIVPADLEPKELLVYAWLYKHSNQTQEDYKGLSKNEVYASSRKISEATEIPQSTVTRILKNLIQESYIKEVYKSKSTKESSKYFLSFNESVFGSVSESVCESVGESVSESVVAIETTSLEGNQKTINESVCGSVNESVSDSISNNISINKSINISNNIYTHEKEIFDYWNSKEGTIHHQESTFNSNKSKISTAIKNYKKENILNAIDRLDRAVLDTKYYYSFKWNLFKFLKQGNGVSNWLDDGQFWNDYISKGGAEGGRNPNNFGKNEGQPNWTKNTKSNLTAADTENITF